MATKRDLSLNITLLCKHTAHGCTKSGDQGYMRRHEEYCEFQMLVCPSRHRNECHWTGPITHLIRHAEETGCFQILRAKGTREILTGTLTDYQENTTVFDSHKIRQWRPILLQTRLMSRYHIYMIVQRNQAGFWLIHFRTYRSPGIGNLLSVNMEISSLIDKNLPAYTYEGAPLTSVLSQDEVLREGNFFLLSDAQVMKLRTGKTLFRYDITLNIYERKVKSDPEREHKVRNTQP